MAVSNSPVPNDGRYTQVNQQQRSFGIWVIIFATIITVVTIGLFVAFFMALSGSFADGYVAPPV